MREKKSYITRNFAKNPLTQNETIHSLLNLKAAATKDEIQDAYQKTIWKYQLTKIKFLNDVQRPEGFKREDFSGLTEDATIEKKQKFEKWATDISNAAQEAYKQYINTPPPINKPKATQYTKPQERLAVIIENLIKPIARIVIPRNPNLSFSPQLTRRKSIIIGNYRDLQFDLDNNLQGSESKYLILALNFAIFYLKHDLDDQTKITLASHHIDSNPFTQEECSMTELESDNFEQIINLIIESTQEQINEAIEHFQILYKFATAFDTLKNLWKLDLLQSCYLSFSSNPVGVLFDILPTRHRQSPNVEEKILTMLQKIWPELYLQQTDSYSKSYLLPIESIRKLFLEHNDALTNIRNLAKNIALAIEDPDLLENLEIKYLKSKFKEQALPYLLKAIYEQDFAKVKKIHQQLLELNLDINEIAPDILFYAIGSTKVFNRVRGKPTSLEILEYLIDIVKADTNYKIDDTDLFTEACKKASLKITKYLYAKLNITRKQSQAVSSNGKNLLEQTLEELILPFRGTPSSPKVCGIEEYKNQFEKIEFLITQGARISNNTELTTSIKQKVTNRAGALQRCQQAFNEYFEYLTKLTQKSIAQMHKDISLHKANIILEGTDDLDQYITTLTKLNESYKDFFEIFPNEKEAAKYQELYDPDLSQKPCALTILGDKYFVSFTKEYLNNKDNLFSLLQCVIATNTEIDSRDRVKEILRNLCAIEALKPMLQIIAHHGLVANKHDMSNLSICISFVEKNELQRPIYFEKSSNRLFLFVEHQELKAAQKILMDGMQYATRCYLNQKRYYTSFDVSEDFSITSEEQEQMQNYLDDIIAAGQKETQPSPRAATTHNTDIPQEEALLQTKSLDENIFRDRVEQKQRAFCLLNK